MKKVFTLLFVFGYLTMMAQANDRLERIKAFKVAFITEKLDLTPKEAQGFWPIYNKYSDDSDKIRRGQREEYRQNVKRGEKLSDLADEVSEKFVVSFLSAEEAQLQLKKKLVKDLKSIISSKKVWRLIRAEDEFKQKMIEEYLSHFEFLVVAGTLIGGWIKFQADYNKLSSRVYALEADNREFKSDFKKLMEDIQEIKLLLAKNQVQ